MAASSNLRTQITSFAAQTVPAPFDADQPMEAAETRSRGRRTNPAAPRITAAALTPPQIAAKLPRPTGSPIDRAGGNPERDQHRQHSQTHGQPHDSDRGYDPAWSNDRRVVRDVSLADRATREFRRDRSPPLSRAPLPRGCATSNCPAMLNQIGLDLTPAQEFCVCRF